ncbi:hypothetical protein QJQ45_024069, partial [Haematococcus lacustris]
MEVQVGSPPPASASTGMHLQYELVLRIRLRTHMCDNVTALVEALAHVAVKALILTPSRLRVRSSVVAGYAASQLLNAIFVLLLLFKLEYTWQASWALIFAFLVAASLLDVPIRCYMLLHA